MQGHGRIIAPDFCVAHREANSGLSTLNRTKSILSIYHQQRQLQKQRGMCLNDTYPFCQQPLSGNCHSICFSKPVLWTATPKRCFSFWRSGRDSNPRTAFGRHTISSRARYDHFDTTAYLNAQQQASLYQNWARSQYPIFAFPQKRDGAALRLFSFCLYFNCSSAASFRQQQKTSIACCSSSTGGRDGATRILLSFGSTP